MLKTQPKPNARACFKSVSIGVFDGGFAFGGKKPKISSIYRIALSELVPSVPRIHAMISFSKRVTKNILSESFRCEMVKILHFALPFSSKSIFEISSLTPCVQPLKLGLAMSAFIFMASFRRSLLG